jgi:hypothetical protein
MSDHARTTYVTGTFRHYKGGLYSLLFVAETHDHNGDRDAVYLSLTTGKIVTRPWTRDSRRADSWCDKVEWPDGKERPRFTSFFLEDDPFIKNPGLLGRAVPPQNSQKENKP